MAHTAAGIDLSAPVPLASGKQGSWYAGACFQKIGGGIRHKEEEEVSSIELTHDSMAATNRITSPPKSQQRRQSGLEKALPRRFPVVKERMSRLVVQIRAHCCMEEVLNQQQHGRTSRYIHTNHPQTHETRKVLNYACMH